MRGVVAALKTNDHVGVGGQQVDDFTLALVAPLRTDHCNCLHNLLPAISGY